MNERLKTLLAREGISQRELARETGLTAAQINRYLSGARKPSGKALIALSEYFKVTTDYLLGYEGSEVSPYEKVLDSINENKEYLSTEERMKLIVILSSK